MQLCLENNQNSNQTNTSVDQNFVKNCYEEIKLHTLSEFRYASILADFMH